MQAAAPRGPPSPPVSPAVPATAVRTVPRVVFKLAESLLDARGQHAPAAGVWGTPTLQMLAPQPLKPGGTRVWADSEDWGEVFARLWCVVLSFPLVSVGLGTLRLHKSPFLSFSSPSAALKLKPARSRLFTRSCAARMGLLDSEYSAKLSAADGGDVEGGGGAGFTGDGAAQGLSSGRGGARGGSGEGGSGEGVRQWGLAVDFEPPPPVPEAERSPPPPLSDVGKAALSSLYSADSWGG